MKNRKLLSVLLAFAILTSLLAGCGNNSKIKEVGSFSSVSNSSTVSSQAPVSSSASSEALPSSSSASSAQPNEPAESQPGQVIVIQTDDKAFDKKFAANPIDKAYIKESNQAFSNVEMVNVSNKFSGLWQKEITHAYSELTEHMKLDSSKKPETLRAEQETWLKGKSEAFKIINQTAQATGGTMAEVNSASAIMDYYRSRAAQIYKELYGYDKNYNYAYKK